MSELITNRSVAAVTSSSVSRKRVLAIISKAGHAGVSCSDIVAATGLTRQTVLLRIRELAGQLVRSTGSDGVVYRLASLPGGAMRSWKGLQGATYRLVQTMDQFEEFLALLQAQRTVAVDTEGTGLDITHDRPCGLVFGWGIDHNYYLPFAHQTMDQQLDVTKIVPPLAAYLKRTDVCKIFWNAKFDLHMLLKIGIDVSPPMHDGIILLHLLDENNEKGLKSVSLNHIGPTADMWEKQVKKYRIDESKRRRAAFSALLKERLTKEREQIEHDFYRDRPFLKFSGITKQQETAKLKAFLKEQLKDHPYAKNKKDDISYDQIPLDIMTPYACADVHYTMVLYKPFLSRVAQHDALRKLYLNEMQLSALLFETEHHGVKIDVPYLQSVGPRLQDEINDLQKAIYEAVGYEFNVGSPQQLVKALQHAGCRLKKITPAGKKLELRAKKLLQQGDVEGAAELRKKITFATDSDTLKNLASQHHFAAKILQLREKQKLLSTYVDSIIDLVDDKRFLHTTFNANVSTGRMSSRSPNLQNIPGRDLVIRRAFTVPEPVGMEGCGNDEFFFVFKDYSQVELRLTAHWSQDPTLLAAYPAVGEDQDVHSITCAEAVMGISLDEFMKVFGDENHPQHKEYKWFRNIAKRVNFGIIYGAEAPTIQRQVSTPDRFVSIDECEVYIQNYFNKYQRVKEWIDRTIYTLTRQGWLQNSFGRYRRLPIAKTGFDWQKQRAGRQGVNYLIQGDAADTFKHAAVRVRNFLRAENAKTRIVNFVHDEIQFYWHRDELHLLKPVKELMEDFPQFSIPIKVDIEFSKRDWASKQNLKVAA